MPKVRDHGNSNLPKVRDHGKSNITNYDRAHGHLAWEGRGYCRNWGGAAQCACALDVLVEVLILQTHHAMEKPEPYCRRYLAFKPEEADHESILRGADDLATSTLNTAHSCMHAQSMFSLY